MTNSPQSLSPVTEVLKPCPAGCTDISPQHMYREICRDMQSPNWNKPVSRIWCPCCGLTMIKEGIEEVRQAWNARGHAQTGQEPDTRALLQFVGWVDSWVSNPVGAYSVHALDGLFRLTREKIAALSMSSTLCQPELPDKMVSAINAWLACPLETRPSPHALGHRVAEIAYSMLPIAAVSRPDRKCE